MTPIQRSKFLGISSAMAVAAMSTAAIFASSHAMAQSPSPVDESRELMMVHPRVVDPFLNDARSHNGGPTTNGGVWSLRTLLHQLVRDYGESLRNEFYSTFFEQWLTTQIADNGRPILPRDSALVETLLLKRFSTVNLTTGKRAFRLWNLPFELIAIVYRPDLRAPNGSDGGELRFVYKLVGLEGEDLKFTLNMEYALPTTSVGITAQDWAHSFHRLGTLDIGSGEYLRALERLTEWNTHFIYARPTLKHIRTNEIAFDGSDTPVWQLREFDVKPRTATTKTRAVASSTENTPGSELNNSPTLAAFVAANPSLGYTGDNPAENPTEFMSLMLPETLPLDSFSDVGIKWQVPGGFSSLAVDNLGLLTCNGCHSDNKKNSANQMLLSGEVDFYHVSPDVAPGETGISRLSKFLTSEDPIRPKSRPGELKRRKLILEDLLSQPWTPYWIP